MLPHGFLRLSCASTRKSVADPLANVRELSRVLDQLSDSDLVLFEELGVTAYTCGELFHQQRLLDAAEQATWQLASRVGRQLVLVGVPVRAGAAIYNCAAVLNAGTILGLVPKQYVPSYHEFNEAKWFRAADGREPREIVFGGRQVPFGIDLLFVCGPATVGVSICEDDWLPVPPSALQALAGALVQCNLSASPETIGKHEFRRNSLLISQSARHISACAYTSAGPSESTTDLVFGGHCAIAENGVMLAESPWVGDGRDPAQGPRPDESYQITADVDLARLSADRRRMTSYAQCAARHGQREFRWLAFELESRGAPVRLKRTISGTPFVPHQQADLNARCAEIFGIQCAGLAKRLGRLPSPDMQLGVSGGLDSTLAALVAVRTLDALELPRTHLHGWTLPGFGTTARTRDNARRLMELLGVTANESDIRELTLRTFQQQRHRPFGCIDPNHNPRTGRAYALEDFQAALAELDASRRSQGDLQFENTQARIRTMLLMNRGFVLGTGDLSELALGWSTYNADHMSMYNVNCSVPKTLVQWIIRYVAQSQYDGELRDVLLSIAATTISPELLPPDEHGEIQQATEDVLGPYVLHDFFLYHAVRHGASPDKIRLLASQADFPSEYDEPLIERTLATFYRRLFSQQFKRSCLPDGPKVGTVSLSPRGDWKMPSDAEAAAWLHDSREG